MTTRDVKFGFCVIDDRFVKFDEYNYQSIRSADMPITWKYVT